MSERARSWPPAALREDKFSELLAQVDALSRDAARSFIAKEERSDVVHDLLAHLA